MTFGYDIALAHGLLAIASVLGLLLALGVLMPRSWESPRTAAPLRATRRLSVAVAISGTASLLVIFMLAFASGAANGILRIPAPSVNDEFAYLLAADTFAQGRLANPQHPMWHHFETFSVSHDPVYVSKYPPAPSAFLAVGQVVFGHPQWGQLLAYALACVALTWMLRAWVGPRWAIVGGVLAALHPVMQHYETYDYNWSNYSWSHSYWGGAVTMMGAALLFGGLRHFVRNGRSRDAFWLAIGLALLALSRPFEGFLASIPAAFILFRHLVRQRGEAPFLIAHLVVPILIVGLPALFFMLHYNEATTGNPLRLAHQHYSDQYGAAAELLIMNPKTPPERYRNREMDHFYRGWVRPAFEAQKNSWEHYWNVKTEGVERFLWFYFGFAAPALLGTIIVLRRRWWRLAACLTAVSFGLVFVTFEFHPHYAAASAPLIQALLVIGMATLWRNRGPYGTPARALVILLLLVGTLSRVFLLPRAAEQIDPHDWPKVRQEMIASLEALPGDDLVVVTYRPDHSVFREWVKNQADLDTAPVVWARDLGDETSRKQLLDYYADRRIWVLRADDTPPSLIQYEREEAGS